MNDINYFYMGNIMEIKLFLKIPFFIILAAVLLTGCGNNKKEDITQNMSFEIKKEDCQPVYISDITISNSINPSLGDEDIKKIALKIRDIMLETYKGVYDIKDFLMDFYNEKDDGEEITCYIKVISSRALIRKHEAGPFIIGMTRQMESLKSKKDKKRAKEIIKDYLAEYTIECNKPFRSEDYVLVRFNKNEDTPGWKLLYPEDSGKTVTHPFEKYYNENYNENYKNNYEKTMQNGRRVLLQYMDYSEEEIKKILKNKIKR